MKRVSAGISNVGMKNRTKQFLLLVIAIVIGVLITQAASAQQNFHKSRIVHHKIVYKVQVHKSTGKVCSILNKKRNYVEKASFFATNRRSKPKPMAEVDSPSNL
jgi:hypothetical protein